MSKNSRCCICGKEYKGWGNNSYPYMKLGNCCCDECNDNVIIPHRMNRIDIGCIVDADGNELDKEATIKTIINTIDRECKDLLEEVDFKKVVFIHTLLDKLSQLLDKSDDKQNAIEYLLTYIRLLQTPNNNVDINKLKPYVELLKGE